MPTMPRRPSGTAGDELGRGTVGSRASASTLIELLVVLGIIAILSSLLLTSLASGKSTRDAARAKATSVRW
jgi:prepilin-type N-terminal cleavage/methylation domain-containing protein